MTNEGIDKNITITSEELRNKNAVDTNGKVKDFSKSRFWYYTTMTTASYILQSHTFWVRSIEHMNDKAEAELHGSDKNIIHALCFCNSDSEKIPMWYLYSGISGKGVSIGFTPGSLLGIIKTIDTVRGVTNEGESYEIKRGKDFDVEAGWIYYRKTESLINYKRKWYQLSDLENDFEKGNCFIKDYPWEYEKEFRIIFKNKTRFVFEHIEIEIPKEYWEKLTVRFAPEWDSRELKKLRNTQPGFMELQEDKIKYSSINIKMSLLERNKQEINRFIIDKMIANSADANSIEIVNSIFGKGLY